MSVDTAQLSESLQTLIDARLDTIDRMLLGRMPRQDRLSIVREVESQLFELLHERNADELTREDVLEVLARLDPPEAYLPEEFGEADAPRVAARSRASHVPTGPRSKAKVARISGALGLGALALVLLSPLTYLLAALLESEIVFLLFSGGTAVAAFTGAVLAVTLGIVARRGGVWAIVGIVTGILSMFLCLCGGIFLLAEFAS